jgi:flagellar hook-length control protein FliK
VLEEKSGARTESSEGAAGEESPAGLPGPAGAIGAAAALLSNPRTPVMQATVKEMAGGAAALPVDLLAHEIVSVMAPEGQQAVEIQFDSRVLDGLRVRVAGDRDGVSIRFSAASSEIASLLTRNVDQLAQALNASGVHVAAINVQTVPGPKPAGEPARSGRESGGQRDNQKQQGDGRQQGRR